MTLPSASVEAIRFWFGSYSWVVLCPSGSTVSVTCPKSLWAYVVVKLAGFAPLALMREHYLLPL